MSKTPSLSIMLSNSNSGSLYLFLRSLSKLLFFLSRWACFWDCWTWLCCCCWGWWGWWGWWGCEGWAWCAWAGLGRLLGTVCFWATFGLFSFLGGRPLRGSFLALD